MHDEWLAVAHAAGQSTGAIRLVAQTPVVVDGHVVHLRAGQTRPFHPIADRDRLAGRYADDRLGEHPIESRVPLPVAAQAGWHALRDHGKDAAERVAAFARRVDGRDHRLAGFPIGRADRRGFDDIPRDC